MATKDWKKISEDNERIHWHNNKIHEGAFVYLQDYIPELKKDNEWTFTIEPNKKGIDKPFKSKSQAISFAKQYMRSH